MNLPAQARNLLRPVLKFSRQKRVRLYVVGGALRDIFLKRVKVNLDIDFCMKPPAISFGRALARKIKSGFVVLDKEHGACRLVKKVKGLSYTLDFTDFRKKTLEEDLRHRDFTINSMAVELDKAFVPNLPGHIIDPYAGAKDIKSKIIRMVDIRAFDEDPLRILRAFSFSCALGFKIEDATLRLARLKRNKLKKVSFERIRDELFKILAGPGTYKCLLEMDKAGILKVIFPEFEPMRKLYQGPYHHLDVWKHSFETLRQLELVIEESSGNKDIRVYLDEAVSSDRRRAALMKLGALLHDVGKPKALRRRKGKIIFHGHERIGFELSRDISRRLKLSNDEFESLKKMVFWHLRPGYLADNEAISARAMFRYFRDTGTEALSVLLLSLADQRSTKGPLTTRAGRQRHERTVERLIREYFRRQKEKKPARLVNGDDLLKKFKLSPSPLVGQVLREIEELQAIGRLKNREDAFKAAAKIISAAQK